MQTHQDERGRAAYSCSAGETSFWKRQPKQLSSTMAFMLGRDEAQFGHVRASEQEPLKECLQWLRDKNPHLQVFFSNAERFSQLYGQLQSVVPLGDKNTPIRFRRTPVLDSTIQDTLGTTLGEEDTVLVVVDPFGLPSSWTTVDILF